MSRRQFQILAGPSEELNVWLRQVQVKSSDLDSIQTPRAQFDCVGRKQDSIVGGWNSWQVAIQTGWKPYVRLAPKFVRLYV
jgi:hypothetical protein